MNQAIKILEEMIADANKSMYPEKGQLDMKEFNVFSCGKASLEIARDRILALPSDTQWIDVKNGNPKGFCNYIVTNGKSSFEAWYSDVDNIFKHIDDSGNCKGITHYMEFPNPPKG